MVRLASRSSWVQRFVWGLGFVGGGLTVGYFAPNLTVGSQSYKLAAFVAGCREGLRTALWSAVVLDCASARTFLRLVDALIVAGALLALSGVGEGAFRWLSGRR